MQRVTVPKHLCICSQRLQQSTQASNYLINHAPQILQSGGAAQISLFVPNCADPLRHRCWCFPSACSASAAEHDVKNNTLASPNLSNGVSLIPDSPISKAAAAPHNNGHHLLAPAVQIYAAMGKPASLASSLLHRLPSSLCQAGADIASLSCNALESLISCKLHSNSLHSGSQPDLQGNFAPVAEECSPLSCSILDGPLPAFLEGMYVRNGPNEQFQSTASTHSMSSSHLFDGDGMLHCVNFHGGEATYCCRYVHTNRFLQERAAGQALFPKIFSSLAGQENFAATAYVLLTLLRHLLGLVNLTKGMGLANTSAIFHHGKLLALGEDDLPYTFCIQSDGDIVNTGRYKFTGHGSLPKAMTSHPKIDKETGEMIFFSYNIFFQPYLTFFRMSSSGTLLKGVPIPLQEPCMIHDFAITPHFIIFPESQIVFHPLHLLRGQPAIKCNPIKVQRFGVLPRNAMDGSKLRWFDVPGCNCFHILNAWEEAETQHKNFNIHHDSSAHTPNVAQIVMIFPNLSNPESIITGQFNKAESTLTEVRLDLDKGKATISSLMQGEVRSSTQTNKMNVEMGTMNENFRGVRNKYLYMGVSGSSSHSLSGLVKIDLESRMVVSRRMFDENRYASEPMFVADLPPIASIHSKQAQEDEGCLLCFLHSERTTEEAGADAQGTCTMLVLDAQSPTLDTLASIKIPRRIPYGFHGLFIPRNNLSF